MNAAIILKLIDAGLAITTTLASIGINYREIMDAQEAAEAAGREFSAADAQVFIDQAQAAIDRL